MTIPAPDRIPYDDWFDYKIPSALYDTLQCWIATESTSKWTTEVDNSIHSKMYDIATNCGLLLGGSELSL